MKLKHVAIKETLTPYTDSAGSIETTIIDGTVWQIWEGYDSYEVYYLPPNSARLVQYGRVMFLPVIFGSAGAWQAN